MVTTERRTAPDRPRARPAWPGWLVPVVLAAIPWGWFLVRDAGSSMNVVAFGLPLGAVVLGLIVFGVAILSARMRLALVTLSLLAFAVVVVVAPRTARPGAAPVRPIRLVAANTYDGNLEPRAAVRALVAARSDVLVVVETTTSLLNELHGSLADRAWARASGLNVFARWPTRELPPIPSVPATSAVRVEVLRPGSPFVLYAIHLANPLHDVSFAQHAATVERLLRAAQGERLPVVLAGDFNMTDRSTSYRMLDGAMRDAMRSSFAGSTYEQGLWALLQLRIDHVFTVPTWCSRDGFAFSVPGSDHEGLSVEIGPCP